LLLTPERNLHIEFDAAQATDEIKITGAAAPENNLLAQLAIGNQPYYMKDGAIEVFAKMSLDSLQTNLLQDLKQYYEDAEQLILSTYMPAHLKEILVNELHYVNQCYLYDLAGNNMRWAKNKDQEAFMHTVMQFEPLPDSTTLVSCLFANMSLENFARYQLINAGKNMRTDSAAAAQAIQQMLGIAFNDLKAQVDAYGERYILNWLYAKNNLPSTIQDKLLFNRINESCDGRELTSANMLLDTLRYYFPNSNYMTMAEKELKNLRSIQQEQLNNNKIVVHDRSKPASLKSLQALHPGKVIYIDIWGTWCGPCRMEMAYVPELKKKFSGKDMVFVYIDMDDASKEAKWKEMLHLYALEGEHYRLSNEEIQPLWKEIAQEGGQTNRYPTFVLMNKQGKIVKANAARPSDGNKLHEQIESLLSE